MKIVEGFFEFAVISGSKTMKQPESHEPLSRLLAAWRVSPTSDPNFRPAVWARIRRGAQESWPGYIRAHLAGWVVATAVAAFAAGWTGHIAAEAKLNVGREKMVTAYLTELDPRVMAVVAPER